MSRLRDSAESTCHYGALYAADEAHGFVYAPHSVKKWFHFLVEHPKTMS